MSGEIRIRSATTPMVLAAACAVASGVLCVAPGAASAQVRGNAQAEYSETLRERVFGRGPVQTGRYTTETGLTFVLDHSGARPLLRFDGASEVWVLRASPAPRGDIVYRNDAGEVVLRSTPSGDLTLYTSRMPGGQPASVDGPVRPLRRPDLSPIQLVRFLVHQSWLASEAVGHRVVFEADEITPGSETLVADAASVAVEALGRMARTPTHRQQARQVRRIIITEGDDNQVSFDGGDLRIVILPRQGPAGRPSSARIVRALAER